MTKTTALQEQEAPTAGAIESVLLQGDLSKLTDEQRVGYYKQVCESMGLNPLTKPFAYIDLNGKTTLYALKNCTDQLRRTYGVSIAQPRIEEIGDNFVVTVTATDSTGRQDSDVGVVSKSDMGGNFGNALMKAITKAKRRVTLSLCGMGMLDETEVETIPGAQIVQPEPLRLAPAPEAGSNALRKQVTDLLTACNSARDSITWTKATLDEYVNDYFEIGDGFVSLTDKELEILKEELEVRLRMLGAEEAQTEEAEEVF